MRTALMAAVGLCAAGTAASEQPLSLLGRHDLICPVCRQVFETLSVTQSNTRGGVDYDLFARALGPQPEYYRISTCPRCGYSGYLSDFAPDIVLPPDLKQRILGKPRLELPAGFGPESDPRELDAADRYRLAIQCYQWARKSDEALGWLYLRASWIARDEGSSLQKDPGLSRVMNYIERWRPPLGEDANQMEVEMQLATRVLEALDSGQFNRYQRPYVELAVALILRRHGENRQAGPMLDRLADGQAFSESLRQGLDRMRESIRVERECQTWAANCFERALLARQITGVNRGPACYLLGELLRRLGRDRDAAGWYEKTRQDPALPADLRKWAAKRK